ncbi:RTA1 like protein-domain-containing protein [Lipomyces tetrasporus]|uniref:RTA1 like protein-domain-containing protein n=1 Tax=Lipomyces tetrasporus TaxID=54092 RepID=A0AAD7QYA7_9ASCO|nr:RTA1 like protein-domain-containing protein [Lipomyces tetrasporus]KAJ8103684.1 RTA1 like protein-domain-containing protein [Lipomyces tetrasporus]
MTPVCLPLDDPNSHWNRFCPSWSAAIAFAVLFAVTTVLHIIQACYYRKSFLWVLIMGAIWELIAAASRVASIQSPTNKNSYEVSFVFLVLAPLWINAFDYVVLGRMVWYYLPEKSLAGIKATRMSTIFVALDITSFIVQLAGALLTVNNNSSSATTNGLHVYTAGVCLQQTLILAFFGLGILFLIRLRQVDTVKNKARGMKLVSVLYASLLLITWRIIYRIIEFSAGVHSTLNNTLDDNEWFVYVFDIGPMFFALVLYHFYHPARVLQGPDADYPTRAQRKAMKEEAKREKQQESISVKDSEELAV